MVGKGFVGFLGIVHLECVCVWVGGCGNWVWMDGWVRATHILGMTCVMDCTPYGHAIALLPIIYNYARTSLHNPHCYCATCMYLLLCNTCSKHQGGSEGPGAGP